MSEVVEAALLPVWFEAPDPDTPDGEARGLVEVVTSLGFEGGPIYPGVTVPPYEGLKFVGAEDLLPVRFASLIEDSLLWTEPVFGQEEEAKP